MTCTHIKKQHPFCCNLRHWNVPRAYTPVQTSKSLLCLSLSKVDSFENQNSAVSKDGRREKETLEEVPLVGLGRVNKAWLPCQHRLHHSLQCSPAIAVINVEATQVTTFCRSPVPMSESSLEKEDNEPWNAATCSLYHTFQSEHLTSNCEISVLTEIHKSATTKHLVDLQLFHQKLTNITQI